MLDTVVKTDSMMCIERMFSMIVLRESPELGTGPSLQLNQQFFSIFVKRFTEARMSLGQRKSLEYPFETVTWQWSPYPGIQI